MNNVYCLSHLICSFEVLRKKCYQAKNITYIPNNNCMIKLMIKHMTHPYDTHCRVFLSCLQRTCYDTNYCLIEKYKKKIISIMVFIV